MHTAYTHINLYVYMYEYIRYWMPVYEIIWHIQFVWLTRRDFGDAKKKNTKIWKRYSACYDDDYYYIFFSFPLLSPFCFLWKYVYAMHDYRISMGDNIEVKKKKYKKVYIPICCVARQGIRLYVVKSLYISADVALLSTSFVGCMLYFLVRV